MGTRVRAETREQIREKLTTRASCLYITPEMPRMKIRGRKTTMVVRVLAMTAAVTSPAPSTAASAAGRPSCRRRKLFSSTTMELSTIMPTPMARPPRLMMFRVKPLAYISTKVAMMEKGMEMEMIRVLGTLRRKNSSTPIAISAPYSAEVPTFRRALAMYRELSFSTTSSSCGKSARIRSSSRRTWRGDFDGVPAGLLAHRQADAGPAVDAGDAGDLHAAVGNLRHLGQRDGGSLAHGHHRVPQLVQVLVQGRGAQGALVVALGRPSPGASPRLPSGCGRSPGPPAGPEAAGGPGAGPPGSRAAPRRTRPPTPPRPPAPGGRPPARR